jgi:multimeric flavodoxin WrbA
VLIRQFEEEGVTSEIVRLVDYNIKPGVRSDEGAGDDWPYIRTKIVAANILVMATPIWLGQHSSLCQRALERMDAMLSETQQDGRRLPSTRWAGSSSPAMRTGRIILSPASASR